MRAAKAIFNFFKDCTLLHRQRRGCVSAQRRQRFRKVGGYRLPGIRTDRDHQSILVQHQRPIPAPTPLTSQPRAPLTNDLLGGLAEFTVEG